PSGEVWAAAISGRAAAGGPPSHAPVPVTPPKEKKDREAPPSSEPTPSVTVSTAVSLAPPPPPPPSRGAESAEILEVAPDDSVASIWQADEDLIYSCVYDEAAGGLLVATGPRGRVYVVRRNGASIEETLDERRAILATRRHLVADSPAAAY